MHKLLLLLLLLPISLFGQTGFTPCKNVESFKQKYSEASKKLESLKCRFVQEKNISMLKNKLISTGEFAFKKNDKLRMEFKDPYKYLFILNGSNVYILDNQKKTEVSSSSNKLFRKISQFTVSSVNGDILKSKDFSNKILESDGQYLLVLTPLNKEIKQFFKLFQIYISKENHMVDKIIMDEASGDKTTLTFIEKQVNTPISDSLFTLK